MTENWDRRSFVNGPNGCAATRFFDCEPVDFSPEAEAKALSYAGLPHEGDPHPLAPRLRAGRPYARFEFIRRGLFGRRRSCVIIGVRVHYREDVEPIKVTRPPESVTITLSNGKPVKTRHRRIAEAAVETVPGDSSQIWFPRANVAAGMPLIHGGDSSFMRPVYGNVAIEIGILQSIIRHLLAAERRHCVDLLKKHADEREGDGYGFSAKTVRTCAKLLEEDALK